MHSRDALTHVLFSELDDTMISNRLDPSDINPDALDALMEILQGSGPVVLARDEGQRVELPDPLFKYLMHVLRLMQQGRPIAMVPEDEECTTQAAADFLGVSRQHLVDLLEDGEIPFHKVGTHRRVKFHDLLDYRKRRDGDRRAALDRLSEEVSEAGLYEGSYTGDE